MPFTLDSASYILVLGPERSPVPSPPGSPDTSPRVNRATRGGGGIGAKSMESIQKPTAQVSAKTREKQILQGWKAMKLNMPLPPSSK